MDLQAIWAIVVEWIPKIATVIAGCALIASVTPSKKDDRILQFLLDIVNKLALNVGKAKNADDV
ncbi:MAG: hypothetical protein KAU50_11405 [Candidatus Marinimicrobia bacterium]|nr:hypothetical protein [Candidatus Neomarinimicrobiota bacterium]